MQPLEEMRREQFRNEQTIDGMTLDVEILSFFIRYISYATVPINAMVIFLGGARQSSLVQVSFINIQSKIARMIIE